MSSTWVLIAVFIPAIASAQLVMVRQPVDLRSAPNGRRLASLRPGATLTAGRTRDGWTQVTLDGYLQARRAGEARDSFPLSAAMDRAPLRATPDTASPVLAELESGMGLHRISEQAGWLRVRRVGWVRAAALAVVRDTGGPRGTVPAGAAADSGRSAGEEPASGALAVEHRTALRLAPDGEAVATLDSTAPVTVLARQRGWVRVRVEGWVRATDVGPPGTAAFTPISAADLRADPDRFRGQTVRWQVQKIAFQTADPLRRGMAPDEPYLLARGPGNENALLYLALPPSLVEQAQRIEPLATLVVVARVRAGRSEPAGVPLLDVLSIAQRDE